MARFRFRAEAALELRRKQEDAARQAHADAERAARTAEDCAQSARAGADAAALELTAAESGGQPGWVVDWHRSWIVRQRLEADARRQEAAVSAAHAECTAASKLQAHQRRRTLERLRDRALRRHQHGERDRELRDMNQLATVRYLTRLADEGGLQSDDDRSHADERGEPHVPRDRGDAPKEPARS